MINIPQLLKQLSSRRPIFHSEADFQHALAWQIQSTHPEADVRLEFPIADGKRGAIDILVREGSRQVAIELKYLARLLAHDHNGERFNLKAQGAHDVRRYDVCKDIQRMEAFAGRTGGGGQVIVLSNDPYYWNGPQRPNTCDSLFNIREGGVLTGELSWGPAAGPGSIKGREQTLYLKGNYRLQWQTYAMLADTIGTFKYLHIDAIPDPTKPTKGFAATEFKRCDPLPASNAVDSSRSDTVAARMLSLLASRASRPICDDCLASTLGLAARQHANLVSRQLAKIGQIKREIGSCFSCKSMKKVVRI